MPKSETPDSMTTILIIDDDADLATVFCDALELNGFATLKAATGRESIQMAQLHHPQLIVCDIRLPDISGYDVLQRLRSHPSTTAIPVIMLTGQEVSDTFRRSMEHGADDYLTKPVDLSSFLRAVQTQLSKRKQLAKYFTPTSVDFHHRSFSAPANSQDLEAQFDYIKQFPWSSLWVVQIRNYGDLHSGYGHVFGQLVIQSLGQQFLQWREQWHQSALSITLAYVGENRFVVFLNASDKLAEDLCGSAMAELRTKLQQPMVINNHPLSPDIHIKAIGHPKLTAIKNLAACLPDAIPAVNQLSLAERLRQAIKYDELQLYFQPQVDLISGQIVGAEALVRWNIPGETQILPIQFIPVAEENGLMLLLGEWILEAALQQLSQWQQKQQSAISIAINLSSYQLRNPQFIDRLMAMVDAAKVSPIMVDLELPESLIIEDLGRAKLLLAELQSKGFSTAIDDFGSGCLSHLQYLPINILKLDKCFVRDLHHNRSNQVIVRAIMEMARGLNISTIANGVETARELSMLKQLKCQIMQGYLFSPALKAEDFEMLLLESSKRHFNQQVETYHSESLQNAIKI